MKTVTIGGVKYKLDNAERYVEKHSIVTALYEAEQVLKMERALRKVSDDKVYEQEVVKVLKSSNKHLGEQNAKLVECVQEMLSHPDEFDLWRPRARQTLKEIEGESNT